MAIILAGSIYGCLVAFSYVSLLQRNLLLTAIPALQKRTTRFQVFTENTNRAKKAYNMWARVWMPLIIAAAVNIGYMWWCFTNAEDLDGLYMGVSAIVTAGILTMTCTKQFIPEWLHTWDSQLQIYRNDVILEALLARVQEINQTVTDIAAGEPTTLTHSDVDRMVMETITIQHATDQLMEEQNARLAQLNKELAESRKNDNS